MAAIWDEKYLRIMLQNKCYKYYWKYRKCNTINIMLFKLYCKLNNLMNST